MEYLTITITLYWNFLSISNPQDMHFHFSQLLAILLFLCRRQQLVMNPVFLHLQVYFDHKDFLWIFSKKSQLVLLAFNRDITNSLDLNECLLKDLQIVREDCN